MSDTEELVVLTDGNHAIELPLENVLRITFVKLMPSFIQYQEETRDSNIFGFVRWFQKKHGMDKGGVLL